MPTFFFLLTLYLNPNIKKKEKEREREEEKKVVVPRPPLLAQLSFDKGLRKKKNNDKEG
jgi:hypothetical protein